MNLIVFVLDMFSSFQWSPDNTKLMYIAEKKLRKTEPVYKQKPKYKAPSQEDEETPERVRIKTNI